MCIRDSTAGLQKTEVVDEGGPVGEWRTLATERKGRNGIETGRLEKTVHAIDVRRGRRQGDEYRHIDTESLSQPDGIIGRGAANVDVLAEHGELPVSYTHLDVYKRQVIRQRGVCAIGRA